MFPLYGLVQSCEGVRESHVRLSERLTRFDSVDQRLDGTKITSQQKLEGCVAFQLATRRF